MDYQVKSSTNKNMYEINNSGQMRTKLFCSVNSIINDCNRRILKNICFSIHSCFITFSIIVLTILYLLNLIQFHNNYSILFVIVCLIFILLINISIYYYNYRLSVKGFPLIAKNRLFDIRRDGISKNVNIKCICSGDIIKLHSGDIVPVDIQITSCNNLQIENHTFSHNEIDNDLVSQPTHGDLLMSKNILFQGSKILTGNVSGIVINEANNTFLAQAANEIRKCFINNCLSHKFFFTNKLFSSLKRLGYLWIGLTLLCVIFLICRGFDRTQILYISIGLAVSIFTPTCIIIILIGLLITHKSFNNCIMKKPEFAITLGKIDILFVNDISMLTQNKFIISKLWIDGNSVNGEEITDSGDENKIFHSSSWTALTRAAVLCNEAYLLEDDDNKSKTNNTNNKISGDTDQSLIESFYNCESIKKWGGSLSKYRTNNTNIYGIKYDYQTNCRISIHKLNDGDSRFILLIQGNLNDVLQCSSTILINGIEENIDLWKEKILEHYEILKNQFIIKAFCDLRLNPDLFSPGLKEIDSDLEKIIPRKGLRFIGMISFSDSLKPSLLDCFEKCKKLGVKLVFTTNKNNIPLVTMSKEINSEKLKTVTSTIVGSWGQNTFLNVLDEIHYLIITDANNDFQQNLIKFCQIKQNIVGVIDSDVNNLSNLLSANVGIMPQTKCNNLCKQLADVTVTDDNFLSLLNAMEKSRNICKIFTIIFNIISYPKISLIFGFLLFGFLGIPLIINVNFVLAFELCFLFPVVSLTIKLFHNLYTTGRKLNSMNYGLIFQIGCIQFTAAIFAYVVVMTLHGFWPRRLFMIMNVWYSQTLNSVSDSYGQEWTYKQRMNLNLLASTTVFYTVGILQIFSLITTVNNYYSIFTNTMQKILLIFPALFGILMIFLVIYGGSLLKILELCYMELSFIFIPLPFVLFIIIFTEIRKLFVRFMYKTQ